MCQFQHNRKFQHHLPIKFNIVLIKLTNTIHQGYLIHYSFVGYIGLYDQEVEVEEARQKILIVERKVFHELK